MPSKLSEEYVREVIESFGCKLIGEYVNAVTKLTIQCSCKKEYQIDFNQFTDKRNTHVCPECAIKNSGEKRKNNPTQLLKKVQELGFWFDINDYVNINTKIKIFDNCGYMYFFTTHYFIKTVKDGVILDKFGRRNPFTKDNIENWIKINNKEYKLLEVDFSKKSGIQVKLKCNLCNKEWKPLFSNNLNGQGCPSCGSKHFFSCGNNNIENLFPYLIKEWDYSKNIISPSRYSPGSNDDIWWICFQCNHSWIAKIHARTGSGSGCPACKMSGGAKRIYYWLKDNYFDFHIEQEFDDLVSDFGYPLRYDFCVYDNHDIRLLIEFDGRQHEQFVPIFHKSQNDFEKRKKYDKIKNEYAKNKGINLIRISYRDFNSIEDILVKNL